MPSPNLARFRSKLPNTGLSVAQSKADATKAEILIYSHIGVDPWTGEGIDGKVMKKELDKLQDGTKEITVRINSPGGSVFDGMTIYNLLKQHKAKVIVRVDGMAASIASIIAMAGDEVIMGEGAFFMIHKPWTWAVGNSDDFDHTSNTLLTLEEEMLNIYSRRTKVPKEELRSLLRAETWMNSEESLEKGFADKVEASEVQIAASMIDCKWIKNAPRDIPSAKELERQMVEDQAKSLLAQVDACLSTK